MFTVQCSVHCGFLHCERGASDRNVQYLVARSDKGFRMMNEKSENLKAVIAGYGFVVKLRHLVWAPSLTWWATTTPDSDYINPCFVLSKQLNRLLSLEFSFLFRASGSAVLHH